MKFQKKPVVVDAIQWNKLGDHPLVFDYHHAYDLGFRANTIATSTLCTVNNNYIGDGLLKTPHRGWVIVHQGDYVITDAYGDTYVTDAEDFLSEFEPMVG